MSEVSQNLNQFKQTPMVGQLDWTVNNNVVPCRILATSSGGALLVAGNAVKLVDSAGPVPIVDLVTGVTDTPWGVLVHNMKGDTFLAGQYVDVALQGSTIYLQTSAAIARGAKIQIDPTGPTVATLASPPNNASLGYSVDKPAAANAVTRFYIQPLDPNLAAY